MLASAEMGQQLGVNWRTLVRLAKRGQLRGRLMDDSGRWLSTSRLVPLGPWPPTYSVTEWLIRLVSPLPGNEATPHQLKAQAPTY
jgi:hypothetical protein